jgi:hypothetical protein
MGDPGLHSKFIEMQQEAAFSPRESVVPENPHIRGLQLDRARILAELGRATAPNHVAILRRSLKAIEQKLRSKT